MAAVGAPVTGLYTARDGVRLRHATWQADGDRPLIVLPGRSEFVEKYQETAGDLTRAGWTVHLLEWRGQGLSHRPPGNPQALWIDDFGTHVSDLLGWLNTLPGPQAKPVMAHSMGGAIAILALDAAPSRFTQAILTAPMLAIFPGPPNPLVRWLAERKTRRGIGQRYAWGQRDFHPLHRRFTRNVLTSDPDRFSVQSTWFRDNPPFRVGGATWGWLDAAYRAMADARGALAKVSVPVTILVGGRDRLVDNRPALAAGRDGHARVIRFPEARHELLMERDSIRDPVIDAVLSALADEPG